MIYITGDTHIPLDISKLNTTHFPQQSEMTKDDFVIVLGDFGLYWQTQDKKTLKKINSLLKSIDRKGYDCEGKPEPLPGFLAGFWSVRIDKKNRIVFRLTDETMEIAECGSHYGDH